MRCTAIINEKRARADEWRKMFGTRNIEITGFLPQVANLEGRGQSKVYFVKLDALSPDQYKRLVLYIRRKFNVQIDEIERELPKIGCPILAEDLIVTCDTPFFL